MDVYIYGDSKWADKLTSYNGQDIVYDAIGNPLEYRGWEFEWSRGRRLNKASKIGYNVNVAYKYDEEGIRTQKVVNGVTTDFITSGIKVLAQKSDNNTIVWQIDGNGNTVGFNYNGTPYFYMKNLQGDIIGITDTSGNTVAKYTYDSWGKLISIKDSNDVDRTDDTTFIGYINPLRYRGYYYDTETNLYYLNARYYDPEVGRFISADGNIFDKSSLFNYCINNPIIYSDFDGEFIVPALALGIGIGTFISYKVVSSFSWDDEQKIYYAGIDMWQRNFGYDSLYDLAIPWIGKCRIDFKDENKKDWIIWMWKGYYGPILGSGAEVGIYTPETIVPFFVKNRCAKNSEMLEMSYTLKGKNNETLFTRGPEKHWWLVGFKPSAGFYLSENLTLDCSITFNSAATAKKFYNNVAKNKKGITHISLSENGSTVSFRWN